MLREHNGGYLKRVYGVVFMRTMSGQALSPFRGRLSGAAVALRCALRARQLPDYRCALFLALMIYCLLSFVGRPAPRNAPSQFIPFDPFLSGGMYCSAAAPIIKMEFPSVTLSVGSPAQAGRYRYPTYERGGLLGGSRLQPSHGSGQNLLCVKYLIRKE